MHRLANTFLLRGLRRLILHDQTILSLSDRLLRIWWPDAELRHLRDDHRRHFSSLSFVHERLGGAIPATTVQPQPPDDTRQLLLRLLLIERRSHRLYAELLKHELPVGARGVLLGNLSNEHVHAAWLSERCVLAPSSPTAGLEHA